METIARMTISIAKYWTPNRLYCFPFRKLNFYSNSKTLVFPNGVAIFKLFQVLTNEAFECAPNSRLSALFLTPFFFFEPLDVYLNENCQPYLVPFE